MLDNIPQFVEVVVITATAITSVAIAITALAAATETRIVKWVTGRLVNDPFRAGVVSAITSDEVRAVLDEQTTFVIRREINGSIDHLNARHDILEKRLGLEPNPYIRLEYENRYKTKP